jgi:hypothetical protein
LHRGRREVGLDFAQTLVHVVKAGTDFLSERPDLGQNLVFFEHTVQIQSGLVPVGEALLGVTLGELGL